MKYLFVTVIVLYLFLITDGFTGIEPAKTQKEKQEIVKQKGKIYIAKIKSGTAWNYMLKEGKVTELKYKILCKEYDKIGNITSVSDYKNDTLISRVEYTYNPGNDMLTDILFSPKGMLIKKTVFKYDKEGRVVSGESFDLKNMPVSRFENKFNKVKKTIESLSYRTKDSLDFKCVYKFNDDYDKWDYFEQIKTNAKGVQLLKVEKKFNFQKQIIEKKYTGTDDQGTYSIEYQYNEKNEILEVIKKKKDGTIDWKETYTYEERGNLYEVNKFDEKNNLISNIRYTYEFYK